MMVHPGENKKTFNKQGEVIMTGEQKKVKRKGIPKKLRFEVFKRDQFTCQYCGRKAPDIVLQVDHIMPVSQGGKNILMNLVTSCMDCNLGKGSTKLSDQSLLEKQRKQAEFLAQRREQIEMLRDWHLELVDQEDAEVEAVNALIIRLSGGRKSLSEHGINHTIKPLLKKYPLGFVLDAITAGYASYNGDIDRTINKLPGICINRADPVADKICLLLNVLNKKYAYFDRAYASRILRQGYAIGGDDFLESAKHIVLHVWATSWSSVKNKLFDLINDYSGDVE